MNENNTETTMTSTLPQSHTASPTSYDLITSGSDLGDVTSTQGATTPEGCFHAISKFVPVENPENLVSLEILTVLEIVAHCALMPLLCIIGMFTNTLNCAVFYRLGLKRGINLCLLLLSVSDQLFLLTRTTLRASKVLLFLLYGHRGASDWDYTMVTYHLLRKAAIFLFFSNFLTTLASVERCVSIINPLKARLIFSHARIIAIVVVVFIVTVVSFTVMGFKYKVTCVFFAGQSAALWPITTSEVYNHHKLAFNLLDNLLLIFLFPALSATVTLTTTTLILHRLRQAARWRHLASFSGGPEGIRGGAVISKAEAQLYRMLMVVAGVHVACTLPSIMRDVSKFFTPAFNITAGTHNLFIAIIAIKDVISCVNCTVNFVIFYRLSAQFRRTLAHLLSLHTSAKNSPTTSSASTTCVAVAAAEIATST